MINRYFSIKDIEEVSTANSDEFFYGRIAVLSTRPNAHKVLITDEILRRDGVSVRGKWVVADSRDGEFMTHSANEVIIGIIPHDAKIDFVVDDEGYTTMYVDAVLSKIYATEVYRMFKNHSIRNVSVEMMTADLPKLEDGSIPIEGLNIVGVTVLGIAVNGSCPNAKIEIVQFSEENAENYYKTFSENESDNSATDSQEINKEQNMKKKTEAVSMSEEQKEAEVESVVEFAESEKDKKEDETKESDDKEKEMSECGDKEMSCGEDKEMSEDDKTEDTKEDSEKEDKDKEMSEDSKELSEKEAEEEKDKDKDKEFACLEGADAELADGVRKVFSSDKTFAVESVFSMAKELKELKEFKADIEKKDKEFAIDKVMAGVKSVLSEKEFDDFRKEGLACDNVDAFTNKVKAFAYDKKIETETIDNGIMEFADSYEDGVVKELTADEIFNKYM